jgi:hypothetical protein
MRMPMTASGAILDRFTLIWNRLMVPDRFFRQGAVRRAMRGIGQGPQRCRRADLAHRRLRFSRPLDGVAGCLWTASPRRAPCLASRRDNPVKLIPYQRETIWRHSGVAINIAGSPA